MCKGAPYAGHSFVGPGLVNRGHLGSIFLGCLLEGYF